MQRVNYQILLYSQHEKRNIKIRVRKQHQKISGEVGNLKRTKDGTNKMRDISKRPNQCQGNPKSPGGAVASVAHESVDCGSDAILVNPITARLANQRGGKNLVKYYKRPKRKAIENRDPTQGLYYKISLYPPHENRKMKSSKKKSSVRKKEICKERHE